MYVLKASRNFQKQYKQIAQKDTKLKKNIDSKLKLLRKDINYPSLRLHKLSGQNIWSISVTMKIRITIGIEKDAIYLLKIGTHDEVY